MFKKITVILSVTLLLGYSLLYAFEKLSIDKNHSTVGFIVPIVGGLSKVTGKFTEFTVDANWSESDPSQSTVSAVIEVSSINTGIEGRDKHLKSPDFLMLKNFHRLHLQAHHL